MAKAEGFVNVTVDNAAPVLEGTAAASVVEGVPFRFGPTVQDAGAVSLRIIILLKN